MTFFRVHIKAADLICLFTVLTFAPIVDKTAGVLPLIKEVAPNSTIVTYCIFKISTYLHAASLREKKSLFYLKTFLFLDAIVKY